MKSILFVLTERVSRRKIYLFTFSGLLDPLE